jgi:hypothetical protein
VVFEASSQLLGLVDNLFNRSWHHHLKYFDRAFIAWTTIGLSSVLTTPTS